MLTPTMVEPLLGFNHISNEKKLGLSFAKVPRVLPKVEEASSWKLLKGISESLH